MEKYNFGKKLRQIRLLCYLSQADLAKKMGVPAYTISNWEQGRSEPCIEDIRRLCEVLRITASDLLEI